jgi:ABC-type polysaccharide/polyol phosphate export permease
LIQLGTFISNVGFPITVACALAYILWQMWSTIRATCNQLTNANAELVKTNSELVASINNKIDGVGVKIDKLVEELK